MTTNGITDATKRLREEDLDDRSQTSKRSCLSSEPSTTEDDGEDWRPPCKIQETKGRVAAHDYELVVGQIPQMCDGLVSSLSGCEGHISRPDDSDILGARSMDRGMHPR